MAGGFDLEGLLGTMSPDALRETVRRLVGVYGEGAERIVMETADGFTRRVSENIRDLVSGSWARCATTWTSTTSRRR